MADEAALELVPVDHDPFGGLPPIERNGRGLGSRIRGGMQNAFDVAAEHQRRWGVPPASDQLSDIAAKTGEFAWNALPPVIGAKWMAAHAGDVPGQTDVSEAARGAVDVALNTLGAGMLGTERGALGTSGGAIKAYHGSPHDFEKFDISKIGTGEGAQAFGHGLYFAENEGVAKQYRRDLSDKTYRTGEGKGASEPHGNVWQAVYNNAQATGVHPDVARQAATHVMDAIDDSGSIAKALKEYDFPLNDPRSGRAYQEAIASAQRMNVRANPGKMYEVAIKAHPEHFLDWDKPLTEQPTQVQQLAKSHGAVQSSLTPDMRVLDSLNSDPKWKGKWDSGGEDRAWMHIRDQFPNLSEQAMQQIADRVRSHVEMGTIPESISGQRLVNLLEAKQGREGAAATLREAGVPGIKYLDQGSRGKAGEGTRNYVVFDDKLIDILKKYGIAGIGALPAMGAYHFQTNDVKHDPFQ